MTDLFRRDQADGISPPNLDDGSSFAEHINRARGKRTRYTSVSTSRDAIRDLDGDQVWKLLQPKVTDEGHVLVQHADLVASLRALLSQDGDERERELAARAIPRALRRREALIDWRFQLDSVDRKDRINWAQRQVRQYFVRG